MNLLFYICLLCIMRFLDITICKDEYNLLHIHIVQEFIVDNKVIVSVPLVM